MATLLDQTPVTVGMTMYCMAYGPGTVTQVRDDIVYIDHGDGVQWGYREGVRLNFSRRTLYFNEPYVVSDRNQDPTAWEREKEMIAAVRALINSFGT